MNREFSRSGTIRLVFIFAIYGLCQAIQEYRVLLLSDLGMSAAECGYVLAATSLLVVIARPLSGAIADKLRSRRGIFIFINAVWIAVMVTLIFFAQVRIATFVLCAGVIPIMGICNNTSYGMVEAEGVTYCLKNPKVDYSLIRMCLSIGYCGINYLYTPIVNRFGLRAPFVCTMVWVIILMVVSLTDRSFGKYDADSVQTKKAKKEKLDFGELFKSYFLIVFVAASFFQYLGGCTSSYLVYLLREVGMNESAVGIAAGIRVTGEILIMPLVPFLKKKISIPMLQLVACGFQVIQMVVCIFCRVPWILVGIIICSGFAGGITLSTTAVYLRMLAPEKLITTTMSLCSITQNLGSVLSCLFGGIIIEAIGIFSLYKIALGCYLTWYVLYIGTWLIGVYVLKKKPPIPMFLRKGEGAQW